MVRAKTLLSEKELRKGIQQHIRYKHSFTVVVPMLIGGILFLLTTVFFVIYKELTPSLGLGIFCISIPLLTKWSIQRNLKKLPLLGTEIIWIFERESVSGRGEGFEFRMAWKDMTEALLTSEGILIYPRQAVFYWIPKTAFDEALAFEEVGRFVKQGVPKISIRQKLRTKTLEEKAICAMSEYPLNEMYTQILKTLKNDRFIVKWWTIIVGFLLLSFLSMYVMYGYQASKNSFTCHASYLNEIEAWARLREISEQHIQTHSHDPMGYWYAGRAYCCLEDWENALKAYQHAIVLQPEWEKGLSPCIKKAREELNKEKK